MRIGGNGRLSRACFLCAELVETAVCSVFVFVSENWGKRPFIPCLLLWVRIGETAVCPVLVFVSENWEKRPFVLCLLL